MNAHYTATGTLVDGRTVMLDESIPVASGRVKVVVETEMNNQSTVRPRTFQSVLEEIWEQQRLSGFVPPTAEEVDRRIQEERDSWNDA